MSFILENALSLGQIFSANIFRSGSIERAIQHPYVIEELRRYPSVAKYEIFSPVWNDI
jgi:hypothetical protein